MFVAGPFVQSGAATAIRFRKVGWGWRRGSMAALPKRASAGQAPSEYAREGQGRIGWRFGYGHLDEVTTPIVSRGRNLPLQNRPKGRMTGNRTGQLVVKSREPTSEGYRQS